jgi:hypothetical protein
MCLIYSLAWLDFQPRASSCCTGMLGKFWRTGDETNEVGEVQDVDPGAADYGVGRRAAGVL